ncbi:MAG: glycosyltransferase family 2 protein [Thermodesulfobacteriota bacterium]
MREPKVLIIIVTFNKKEYVANLLETLRAITHTNHDIVVVDNASTDGTVALLEETFPGLHLIKNQENNGGSGGFNTGLAYAFTQQGYDYLWLLDNDVEVAPDALSRLIEVLEQHGDIAVAGSQMCQLDNPAVTNEVGAYVDLRHGRLVLNRHLSRKANNATGIHDVDYVAAASLLIRAEVAKKAGLWEDFFIHFDDVDWCLRIREMGYRVVGVADSVIWHVSAAEKPITWAMYYDVRNMLFLLQSHATRQDVGRFGRRKVLQAIHCELRGLTPLAELIFEAIEDFLQAKKGKKAFHLPREEDDAVIAKTHPASDVLLFPDEWFDPMRFPCDDHSLDSVKEIVLPAHLPDAGWYWHRKGGAPVKNHGALAKIALALLGLLTGHRRYRRAYASIRNMGFLPALLAEEVVVKIAERSWLLKRDRMTVWRTTFRAMRRGIRLYWKLLT